MKTVTLKSGLKGWQGFLRENYESFAEFQSIAENYNLHGRLGYTTPKAAWDDNPVVQGGVQPNDFGKVLPTQRKRGALWGAAESTALDIYQTICRDTLSDSKLKQIQTKLAKLNEVIQLLRQ
jgi:hypothetical protein